MVTFVEDAIADYNDCALKDGRVRRSFEKCGLNPYVPSLVSFIWIACRKKACTRRVVPEPARAHTALKLY